LADCGKRVSQKQDADSFIEVSVAKVREIIGGLSAIVGVSGGVDSTVAAVLVHRAIGDRLHPIMVNHGLLRQGEVESVVEPLRKLGIEVCVVDAQDRFLNKLLGVTDPELKRKIIGEEFIRVFEEEAKKYKDARFLVQGTIYPDVVESGSSQGRQGGQLVKSHHNVGGLPENMQFELVEPLRDLYKDEVKIVIGDENPEVMLSVDGQDSYRLNSGKVVRIRSSSFVTNLVKLKQRSFFDVLRRKISER